MTALRTRLALLLVAAILAVVLVAAFITAQILENARDGSFQRSFAQEVVAVSVLVGGSAGRARGAGIEVGPPPQASARQDDFTQALNAEIRRRGSDVAASVVVRENGTRSLAFPLDGAEWAFLTYPSPPPSFLRALAAYLLLVVIGASGIALFAAAKILGPMRVIEDAVAAIGPDGVPPAIPEKGPAEVRATARALNALSARLKSATESRMRLVAAAGHDLRTPMTRLRLRAEFLPESERAVWLRDLDELDAIADSAIRLVREEAEDASFQPVALGGLAREIVGELREVGLPAELGTAADAKVRAQPLALKRALRNLVENAARHGGGARVQVLSRDGRGVFLVEDEGPGIPPELLSRVFEPFFRVDAARRKSFPGAGLGLAIAREIIERQGGTIAIRNRLSGGLEQTVELPLDR